MIYDPSQQPSPQQFDVRIGHSRVRVESRTRDEAIQAARQQLCDSMPRMWDVISNMADVRFVVEQVSQG